MGTVTFTHLDEIPDHHLDRLIALLTHDGATTAATAPRLTVVYTALEAVLRQERRRREQGELSHSAPAVAVTLPATGELNDAEMQAIMHQMLTRRTAVAGGTPAVGRFFGTVLAALQTTRTDQQEMLRRMHGDQP